MPDSIKQSRNGLSDLIRDAATKDNAEVLRLLGTSPAGLTEDEVAANATFLCAAADWWCIWMRTVSPAWTYARGRMPSADELPVSSGARTPHPGGTGEMSANFRIVGR